MLDLENLLRTVADNSGSDLHLRVGSPPRIRVDGVLRGLPGDPVASADTRGIAHAIMSPDTWERLEQRKEADFAHSVAGVGRFRVNASC
jgi:twitching motility protein PilT